TRPDRIDRQPAAARDRLARDQQQIEQQLDPVFGQQRPRQVPGNLGLVVFEKATGDGLGIAEVDLGAGRARGAKGDAAELQFSGAGTGAFLDQIEGEGPSLLVLGLIQNFQAVDDGADGADQIVTDTRAQQCGKI